MLSTIDPEVAIVASAYDAGRGSSASGTALGGGSGSGVVGSSASSKSSAALQLLPATCVIVTVESFWGSRTTASPFSSTAATVSGVVTTALQPPVKSSAASGRDAAMFFTSGSTGTPKACATVARALASYARAKNAVFDVTDNSVVLVGSPPTFDPALGDAVATWLAGGTLAVAPPVDVYSDLCGCLRRSHATHLLTTPSLLGTCDPLDAPSSLRVVGVGGEPSSRRLVDAWAPRLDMLLNVYGVTEACIYQAYARLRSATSAAIDVHSIGGDGGESGGRGTVGASDPRALGTALHSDYCEVLGLLPNTLHGEPAPLDTMPCGELFELVLIGEAVAPGYVGAPPSLQQQHFWDAVRGANGFRTGDFAMRKDDGEVVFKGRKDGMVKINGVRIECGEVESALTEVVGSAALCECGVVAHGGRLWAFCTSPLPVEARPLLCRTARCLAGRVLPRNMVPSAFVVVDEATLPVSSNGKVDRKSLVARARDSAEAERSVAPSNDDGDGNDGSGRDVTGTKNLYFTLSHM